MTENTKAERPKLTRLERAKQLRAKAQRLEIVHSKESRKQDTRRKVLLGGACIAECRENPEFMAQLAAIIQKRVVKPVDVAAVADWQSFI